MEPKTRTPLSLRNTFLRLTTSLRLRGTKSTIRKTLRKQEKTEQRISLLEAELRAQLLRVTELKQEREMAQQRLMELFPPLVIRAPELTPEQALQKPQPVMLLPEPEMTLEPSPALRALLRKDSSLPK